MNKRAIYPIVGLFIVAVVDLLINLLAAAIQEISFQNQFSQQSIWLLGGLILFGLLSGFWLGKKSQSRTEKPVIRTTPRGEGSDKFDVFISYSNKDRRWVRKKLVPRLEEAGLKVCIDFRDFIPGKPALVNLEDAVKNSRHTLLVLTPNWIESEWTTYEGLLVQSKDPAGIHRRTIPVMLETCELPDRIAMLTYVNFTRDDRLDTAWKMLLTGVGAPPESEPTKTPTPANWLLAHPYPMPPNFTGREAEKAMLTAWLDGEPDNHLFVLRALGGFGKSALTWHWLLHDVDPAQWPRVVWWSFYETEAKFDSFLRDTLEYLKIDPGKLNPRAQVDTLLRELHQPGTLLILDGFERALRAYSGMSAAYMGDEMAEEAQEEERIRQRDCVNPLAETFLRGVCALPGIRGKVLMSTRLRPRVLEVPGATLQGCREEELTQMHPADAVAFFRARGIRGGRAEIEAACEPYGYHPLSLSLLAGIIAADLHQPGDIAVVQGLDIGGDLVARQHHVLKQAYDNLTDDRRTLLNRIAAFRGAVTYEAQQALAGEERKASLDDDLRDLVARGLLNREGIRYDLHPIVRRYAYDRLMNKDEVHGQLRDYFAAVPEPDKVERLEDLAPVIELYHHTVSAGRFDEAGDLYYERLSEPIYFQFGAYQIEIELLLALFPDGDDKPPRVEKENDQSWILSALANSYSLNGQPHKSVPVVKQANAILERQDDKSNLATGLLNLASMAQIPIGELRAAEDNLGHSIDLCREIKSEFQEAIGYQELGWVLAHRGKINESIQAHNRGVTIAKKRNNQQIECVITAYSAKRELLENDIKSAIKNARKSRQLADIPFPGIGKLPVDIVRSDLALGMAYVAYGNLEKAEHHLIEALTRCRGINAVYHEADILLSLAKLRAAQGEHKEALNLAGEALHITERSGFVLQGADVNLFLAEMAQNDGDTDKAREYAQTARELATCDGPPDYTYKVTYEAAGALLEALGA